jgi:hypothetical protein
MRRRHLAGLSIAAGFVGAVVACSSFGGAEVEPDADASSTESGAEALDTDGALDADRPARAYRAVWAKSFGGSDGDGGRSTTFVSGAYVLPAGGLLVTGTLSGHGVDFGGGLRTSAGAGDAYVLVLDRRGGHVGSDRFGDEAGQFGMGIAGGAGHVFGALLFQGTIDFGALGTFTNGGKFSSAIVRFGGVAPNQVRPLAGSGGSEGSEVFARRVAPVPGGGVVVLGDWTKAAEIAGASFARDEGRALFVARYFQDQQAADRAVHVGGPGSGDCLGNALAASSAGVITIGGSFSGTLDFGGGPNERTATGRDAYVARLDADLEPVWGRFFGGTGTLEVVANAHVPSSADVVVAGTFDGTIELPGGPIGSGGGKDLFVARLDGDGAVVWAETFGGADEETVRGLAVDRDGNVVFGGAFRSATLDFGGGPLVNAGDKDVYLACLDASGAHLWSERFGGDGEDEVWGLGLDSEGGLAIAGVTTGPIGFGATSLEPKGARDLFVAHFEH